MSLTDWPAPQRQRLCRLLWTIAGCVVVADVAIALSVLDDGQTIAEPTARPLEPLVADAPKVDPTTTPLAQYAALWQRDVSADFTPKPPPKPEPEPEPPPPPKLALKALLHDAERPMAVVVGPDGKPIVLPAGIERRGLRLLGVQPRAAVVGYEGQTLRLELTAETLPVHIEEIALTARTENPPHAQDAKP